MLIHTDDADEPVEVDPDSVELEDDDPYLSQDEVDNVVSKRLSRQERTLKSELKESDEFFEEAARERGIELREDGMPKGSTNQEELKKLRKEKAQLEEKAQRADELEAQIAEARETQLENELLKHADGVKDDLQDAFMMTAKSRMTYDESEERHVATEDGEVAFTSSGEPAGPKHVVQELKESKPSFFKSTEMNGGPEDSPSATSGGKKVWTEEEHASADPTEMDQETYEDWSTAGEEGRIKG